MVADSRAASDLRQPQVEEAGLAHAQDDADEVDHDCRSDHPRAAENEEQLGRDHRIGSEVAIGHAGEHLRSCEGDEKLVAFDSIHPPNCRS